MMIGYSTDLRSMTGGMGEFSYEFARYEQAPSTSGTERERGFVGILPC